MHASLTTREPILRKRRLRMTLAALILVAVLMVAGALGCFSLPRRPGARSAPARQQCFAGALQCQYHVPHNEELNPCSRLTRRRNWFVALCEERADCCRSARFLSWPKSVIDQSNWRQVARRDESFALWEPLSLRSGTLPAPARPALHRAPSGAGQGVLISLPSVRK